MIIISRDFETKLKSALCDPMLRFLEHLQGVILFIVRFLHIKSLNYSAVPKLSRKSSLIDKQLWEFLCYLKVTKATISPSPFPATTPAWFSFVSRWCEWIADANVSCKLFPKCIPHKTINLCIPLCQVMDTSVSKRARRKGRKKPFIVWGTVEFTIWRPQPSTES